MWQLANQYSIRVLDEESFQPLFLEHTKTIFDDTNQVFHLRKLFSDEEKTKLRGLNALMGTPYTLRLGVFKDEQFVGWHFGYQETAFKFYMCNSAILPELRQMGLYTELLNRTISILIEKGFQEIYGRHMPTNNQVIIPKLKAGFVITSMQLDDVFGVLVHLTYYPNQMRNKVLAYRSGYIRMDSEIETYF